MFFTCFYNQLAILPHHFELKNFEINTSEISKSISLKYKSSNSLKYKSSNIISLFPLLLRDMSLDEETQFKSKKFLT